MEQNNSISNKSFKVLIFMNIILIILVVCLIGYIVYDKVIVDKNNTNNNNTIINPIDNNDNKVEENKETERIDANVLYNNVSTMIEGFITKELTPYLMKFNHNYMTDKVAQNNLVVSALLSDQSIKKEYPKLPIIITGDALYACEPVITTCKENKWEYPYHRHQSKCAGQWPICSDKFIPKAI